jgi:peptidoglycan/LPS O-acetylase OafA/YrhL
LLAHGFGWTAYLGHLHSDSIFCYINVALLKIFQASGETHPAVLGFIVLSGYCIHRNGFRLGNSFSLKSYAIRRSFRILPVYCLASIIGIVLWFLGMQNHGKLVEALTGTTSISLGCFLVKISGIASFIPTLFTCSFEGNAPLATAIVECWLYVYYGLVIWRLLRHEGLKAVYWIFGIGWACSFAIVLLDQTYSGWWHNSSFFAFGVYWWIGAKFSEKDFAPNPRLVIISILVLIPSFIYSNLILVELKKIGLSIIFAYFIRWADNSWRKSKYLAIGGQAGYSIYALHAPVLIALLMLNVPLYLGICFILLLSLLCHYLFELPILNYGKRLSRQYI